jgi:ribosome-binding factor A
MAGPRMRRIDEAMREVLGEAISRDLSDPRLGFVTVTGVRTSSDLRHARVYVSVLGTDEERATTLEGLQSAQGYLQARVSQALRIKHTPALVFDYDESVDRGMRMTELIDKTVGREPVDRSGEE